MLIVGACGKKRHGKDSIGQFLIRDHGFRGISFADPIKKSVMDWYGFTYDQVYGDLKEVVDERWGITPRHAMQQVGTEVGRTVHKDTWIRKCLTTIQEACAGFPVVLIDHEAKAFREFRFAPNSADRWVVMDNRFPNEGLAIKGVGGFIVKVVRPNLVSVSDLHSSETEVDQVQEDCLVLNDGTLKDLGQKVGALPFLQTVRQT